MDIVKRGASGTGKILPVKTKLFYGVSDLGTALPLSAITFFLLYFYTDVAAVMPATGLGLTSATAGLALFLAKIWDAISDPLMGQISDRTRSRWGRRRPYLLFGALPYTLFFILLFTPPIVAGKWPTFAYLLIMFILFFTSSTVVAVPYNALLPELSLDSHERTKLMAFRQPFSVAGWVIGSAVLPLLVVLFSGGMLGYSNTAILFGAICCVALLTTFYGVKEREGFKTARPLPLVESFRQTFSNGPFWIFIAVYTLTSLGYTILSTVLIYYSKYWLGKEELFTPIMAIVMGCLLLSIPMWVYISGRIGKKETFVIGIIVLISAVLFIFSHPRETGPLFYAIMVVAGIGTGAYFLFPYAIMPEIIDLDELKTGTRREGAYFGIYFLIFKIAIALAPFIVGVTMDRTGFVPNVPQSDTALFGIRMLVGPVPAIFFSLGLIALFFFPLNKKKYGEIEEMLKEIRSKTKIDRR